MKTLLHLLNQPADDLVLAVVSAQKSNPENTVTVIDLSRPETDYRDVLESVFAADSVQCW
jgi:hypothetical protein